MCISEFGVAWWCFKSNHDLLKRLFRKYVAKIILFWRKFPWTRNCWSESWFNSTLIFETLKWLVFFLKLLMRNNSGPWNLPVSSQKLSVRKLIAPDPCLIAKQSCRFRCKAVVSLHGRVVSRSFDLANTSKLLFSGCPKHLLWEYWFGEH